MSCIFFFDCRNVRREKTEINRKNNEKSKSTCLSINWKYSKLNLPCQNREYCWPVSRIFISIIIYFIFPLNQSVIQCHWNASQSNFCVSFGFLWPRSVISRKMFEKRTSQSEQAGHFVNQSGTRPKLVVTRLPSFPHLAQFTCFLFAFWLVHWHFAFSEITLFCCLLALLVCLFVCLLHLALRQSINHYSTWKCTLFHQLEKKALNIDVFCFPLRKRHSKTAGSETSGGPEEGELVPTKKKSRRTRESKEPKNENTEPREEGQRTPTPWSCGRCLERRKVSLRTSHCTRFDSCSRILMLIFINVSLCLPLTKWFRSETWRRLCYHGWRTFLGVLWSTSKQPSVFER